MAWTTILQNYGLRISATGIACGIVLGFAGTASATKLKPLHEFCKKTGCPDGAVPFFPPIISDNNLYGTVVGGGSFGVGAIYEMVSRHNKLHYRVLYSFCPNGAPCTDGASPESPLIIDTAGNLYGTSAGGGAFGFGNVYELVRSSTGPTTTWTIKTLYDFCPGGTSPCSDGQNPVGRLGYKGMLTGAYDGKSPLYGATQSGGAGNGGTGAGIIYSVTPGTPVKQQVIYNYCSLASCTDGSAPWDVLVDAAGDIYSAAQTGGTNGAGAVTEVDPQSKVEGVLYSFCPQSGCTDGQTPLTPLAMDAKGNLYGTTIGGGLTGYGVVFKVVPKGVVSTESTVYSFCGKTSCTDGAIPYGGVAVDSSGNLYGTTEIGGEFTGTNCDGAGHGCGVVFQLHGLNYTVLHSFCETGPASCRDGALPLFGPMSVGPQGNPYGVTILGGKHAEGVIFKVLP